MYQYQVTFGEAIKRAFNNYCNFSGRASRSEYWWFILFVNVVTFALYMGYIFIFILSLTASSHPDFYGEYSYDDTTYVYPFYLLAVMLLFDLSILLPSCGLLFRRLHDTGRSGWMALISLIPFVGAIILFVFCCQESQPFVNKYGPQPNMTTYPERPYPQYHINA